jgi:hypothetical protein
MFGWLIDSLSGVVPWLLVLGAATAWVTGWISGNRLYCWLAVLLVLLAAFQFGVERQRGRCETAALRSEIEMLRSRAGTAERLAQSHARRLTQDDAEDRLNEERAYATPPNNASCLDRDAAGRLRAVR